MNDKKPTRAQQLAERLRTEKERLIAEGVLSPDPKQQQIKSLDKETTAQKERRPAAVAKLRTFFD